MSILGLVGFGLHSSYTPIPNRPAACPLKFLRLASDPASSPRPAGGPPRSEARRGRFGFPPVADREPFFMSPVAELMDLTLADVLNDAGLADLYSIPEEECPLLADLCGEARRTILAGRPVCEQQGLQNAALGLRALLLAAMRKPMPATWRFLRRLTRRDFDAAIRGLNPPRLAEQFRPPVAREALATLTDSDPVPCDLADAVRRGLHLLCPPLMYAAARRSDNFKEDKS